MPGPGRESHSVLLLLALLAYSAGARAESPPWLHTTAPPECPDGATIAARVREWLGRPVPVDTELEVRGSIRRVEAEWEVDVLLTLGETSGTRRIRTESCADAADFIAVTVVLALDPSRLSPDGAPLADPTPPPPRPVASPKAVAAPPSRQKATPSPKAEPSPSARRRQLALSAGAQGMVGVLPSLRVGPTGSIGLQVGALALSLGGTYFPELTEAEEIAAPPIGFSLVQASARGCALFVRGALAGGPCVNFDGGAMMANEAEVGGRQSTEPYLALGAGVRGEFQLTASASLVGTAGVLVPLTQPRFVLTDGTLVHQPQLGGTFLLEFVLRLPGTVTKPGRPDTQ